MQFSAATTAALERTPHEWLKHTNNELVDFILERYHAVHREQLPAAIELARTVERVHADHPMTPRGLAEHLTEVFQELESHMLKEEQVLFPLLRSDSHPQGPISVMVAEHSEHEEMAKKIEKLIHNFKVPVGACGTWQKLIKVTEEFVNDLYDHIELENEVLFVSAEVRQGQCCGACS